MSEETRSIHHVDDFSEYGKLIKNPCVVKFTATWCGPCRRIAPFYQKHADENMSQISFLEIDIDNADEITNHEDVKSIPLVLFYLNGVKMQNLSVVGGDVPGLENSINNFVEEVKASLLKISEIIPPNQPVTAMSNLALDDIVESDGSFDLISDEEDSGDDEEGSVADDEDDSYHEYGEDHDPQIEKTISEEMIREN